MKSYAIYYLTGDFQEFIVISDKDWGDIDQMAKENDLVISDSVPVSGYMGNFPCDRLLSDCTL